MQDNNYVKVIEPEGLSVGTLYFGHGGDPKRKSFSAEVSVENERILWAMKRWEIENLMAVAAFCCILFEN